MTDRLPHVANEHDTPHPIGRDIPDPANGDDWPAHEVER